jgi:ABC-type amino acid transport substrate-binding protein
MLSARSYPHWLLSLACGLLLLGLTAAPARADRIKVAVAGSAPFVTRSDGGPDGLSVRIWTDLAREAGLEFDLVPAGSVPEALEMVANDEADVAIGPISITAERARTVAFTQPYFEASLGILSRAGAASLWQRVKPFFSRAFWVGASFLFCLLGLVGTLVWLVERKTNPDFPEGKDGIGHGMWFAVVTMTTVGYGDKAPRTMPGRILATVWMLVATLSFSTLTAGIATALALSSIDAATLDRPEMMLGKRAAVVPRTTGADAAQYFQARLVPVPDLDSAINAVKSRSADLVVFDYPALEYHLMLQPEPDLALSETRFSTQHYGFAVAQDSPLLFDLDVALLQLRESGDLKSIEEIWLKDLHLEQQGS